MRTEAEIRALLSYYVDECESGIDAVMDKSYQEQPGFCLWCVRVRLLHWVLGDVDKPDDGEGAQRGWMDAWASALAKIRALESR